MSEATHLDEKQMTAIAKALGLIREAEDALSGADMLLHGPILVVGSDHGYPIGQFTGELTGEFMWNATPPTEEQTNG